MEKSLVMVTVAIMIAALVSISMAQHGMVGSGMGGSEMPIGHSPKAEEGKPGESASQMPMTSEYALRMMNACIGAMESMAQMGQMMGGMMGGHGGGPQTPPEPKQ